MVETCVGPSELHLKKELTALQKARFLRDPETCSSWRSPLRSNSYYVSPDFKCLDGIRGNSTGVNVNGSGGLPEIPPKSGNRRKAYLYNWRLNSTKSSDTPEDGLDNHHKTDPNSDTNIEIPVKVHTSFAPARRTSRKLKRSSISKQRLVKNSDASKLLELPSNSFGGVNSVEHSDDTEECYSEDIGRQLKHAAVQKNGYGSHVASPLFSGSGRGNRSYCSKILSTRREDSSHSYTPASTSSYYKYGGRNPSTVGSWDETTGSLDGDDLDQLDLQGRQGCGLPCYGSRRTKGRGCGGFYSPSLSDILRRKRSNNKRSSSSHIKNRTSQDLPLLTNSADGGDSSVGPASDDLSTNIGELELEALSRLDGRRWPSCKSQEGFESARHIGSDLEMANPRSLSQKYRLTSFDDIIGQNIVVHSLSNATTRGRIAPAYLFHGPRGTGKTSTARIFTAALNCLSTEGKKPCGVCRECTHSLNGDSSHFREVDSTDKKGIDRVRYLLKNISVATEFSKYNVFVIDQCHMLSTKMWSAFMKFLEEPPPRVVFIFITIDLDNLSRAIVSRCQKYLFTKVKDSDIMNRLRKISAEENLDVESDALALIAMNSDGSLRDAETMLDQLSLLGKRITTSLVNDLVGVVSDEKLLDLLEIAMSSDTSETVKRSRELMDSGIDPMALMSQLAGLIMDIIAGTYRLASSQHSSIALGGRSLNEAELERLQAALKILSDAEKQLRLSSERSTWFTAALLQLGSCHNVQHTRSSSSSKQSTKKMNDGAFDTTEETSFREDKCHPLLVFRQQNLDLTPRATSHRPTEGTLTSDTLPANSHSIIGSLMDSTCPDATGKRVSGCVNPDKLAEIWKRCIGKCHSETLRQLLFAHGKLSSIIGTEGALIAFIDFEDSNVKTRAERYLSSITNSIELALNHNVEVRIGLASGNYTNELKSMPHSAGCNHTEKVGVSKDRKFESQSVEEHENSLVRSKGFEVANFPVNSMKRNNGAQGTAEKRQEISVLRAHSMAIDEQRLESAWLQVAERNASGSATHSRREKSQVLSQNGSSCGNHIGLSTAKQWENELNYQLNTIKDSDAQGHPLNQTGGKLDHYDISPSVLHSSSFMANFDSDNRGYESGPGCNGLFCWNTRKTHQGKVKQGTHVKSQKPARISLFGHCGKPKTPESRLRR